MKLQAYEVLPSSKPQPRSNVLKVILLIALTFLVTTIPIYFPYESHKDSFLASLIGDQHAENTLTTFDGNGGVTAADDFPQKPASTPPPNATKPVTTFNETIPEKPEKRRSENPNTKDRDKRCDLFSGEWVPNPEGPYYSNATCDAIPEYQNCMKFGRPDTEFLKWRWKPDDCELPIFDPHKFLELMKGKALAFVGDSVARNHMQSLICLLSKVAYPIDVSDSDPTYQNKRYEYREYDFNISMFWAPYLVKTGQLDSTSNKHPFNLYLDEFNENWTSKIALFDYIIISAGHWFFRPTYFYLENRLVGCLYCSESDIDHKTPIFSYRRAFQIAFRAINEAVGFNGVTFLRTFAPQHYEGGSWDKGGNCARTRPFKRNETYLKDRDFEMYLIQLEELRIAQKAERRNGGKFRLFDATKPMLLRPDGHPSKYGHLTVANQTFPNDCVHWCLPGPIDAWNDFLQELLMREIEEDR